MTILRTERLRLVPVSQDQFTDLHAMNSDAEVMRYIHHPQSDEETRGWIARSMARWDAVGYGWSSIYLADTETFVGAVCLQNIAHDDTSPLEVGWRLLPTHLGCGYATEAGRAMLQFGFDRHGADRILAVTLPENTASARVMKRLGMTYIGIQRYYDTDCATYEARRP